MNLAALTMFAFAIYLAVMGVLLLLMPALLCQWLSLEPPGHLFWVRLSGMFALRIAIDFLKIAWGKQREMIRWSVLTRQLTLPFLAGLWLIDGQNPIILLLGGVDVAASLWTASALRAETPPGQTSRCD